MTHDERKKKTVEKDLNEVPETDMETEAEVEVEADVTDVEETAEEADDYSESFIAKEAEAKEHLDRLQRTMAEFDNFRKRTLKEKSQMYENGAKDVLEKLLPVIDNFERALSCIKDDEKKQPFVKGVDMIYKQLMATLSDIGVEEIEAEGQEFDPNLHHAVSHEENDEYGDNQVAEVMQKGYLYRDQVLRYSMVKVVN